MTADAMAAELHALCIAKGWRHVEMTVGCDGRVSFLAFGTIWPVAQADADLLVGGPLPTPAQALRQLAATKESET